MSEPRLTVAAQDDLANIWAAIAKVRDERSADRMNRKILEACRLKARFPETGRMREEIAPGLRSTVVRPYVIFFQAQAGSILVLRILHGRRDIEPLLREINKGDL
jgi:toxin ParE1/3/4